MVLKQETNKRVDYRLLTITYDNMRFGMRPKIQRSKGESSKIMTRVRQVIFKLKVTNENIAAAVANYDGNQFVIAYEYTPYAGLRDDVQEIILRTGGNMSKPVIYQVDLREFAVNAITYAFLQEQCAGIPECIRIVYKLPKDYYDMATIWNISRQYPNVSFCGGKLIAIPEANIGCIRAMDINKARGILMDTQPPMLKEDFWYTCIKHTTEADCGICLANVDMTPLQENEVLTFVPMGRQSVTAVTPVMQEREAQIVNPTALGGRKTSTLQSLGGMGLTNF